MSVSHTHLKEDGIFCSHCGVSHKITFPIDIKEMRTQVKAFNILHKNCPKTWVEPQPDMSQSEYERIDWWIENGQKGTSSKTMLYICYGKRLTSELSHPLDPSDFMRCHKLVQTVPEIKNRFYALKEHSPVWSNLVDNWDKLTELLEEQLETKKPNGMFDLMKELGC